MLILGAGMAGCIAGVLNQNATILEPGENRITHQALLRFRSPDIGKAVGIPFKEVTVYKGIWHNDQSVPLTPRAIVLYSRKVSDTVSYRSITNQEKTKRWVAPLDFHAQLRQICSNRIEYNANVDGFPLGDWKTIISTLPISIMADILGEHLPDMESKTHTVTVSKYIIPDADVHMTYYYTDPTIGVYRASIEGCELIIESMWDIPKKEVDIVARSFGLSGIILEPVLDNYKQHNGKILPINDEARKDFIVKATDDYNIYSLGRFATWRNLVLDDVYKDILKIKELMNKSRYDRVVR